MIKHLIALLGILLLTACGGSSSFLATTDDGDGTAGVDLSDVLPPGTTSPSATSDIFRSEPTEVDGGGVGDGFAEGFVYDVVTDSFTVDNLAFDGDNSYTRLALTVVPDPNWPFAMYESAASFDDTFPDPEVPINQFTHRLIYGTSTTSATRFAIVRTGNYLDYGFGGFIYERDGAVSLPTTGQAAYSGAYHGLVDFQGRGGLEVTTGDMSVAIDFEDFNDGNGVRGSITNRRFYDLAGNDISDLYLDALSVEQDVTISSLPTINFSVAPGVMDANGEMTGGLTSFIANTDGGADLHDSGNYYAVISGENAEEIVGIVVVESADPFSDGTRRETGGFIVYR